jgi:hypothetical protein
MAQDEPASTERAAGRSETEAAGRRKTPTLFIVDSPSYVVLEASRAESLPRSSWIGLNEPISDKSEGVIAFKTGTSLSPRTCIPGWDGQASELTVINCG